MIARRSVTRRLLVLVLGAVAVVWLTVAAVVYVDARHELDELLDGHLAQAAALIMAQSARAPGAGPAGHVPMLHEESRRVTVQVWRQGVLVLHTENAPDEPLARRTSGYSDAAWDGERWRVFSSRDEDTGTVVHVGERDKVRRELARDVAVNLLTPLLYALPALALLLWLAIARGMKPLKDVAQAVAARAPANLTALQTEQAPLEVAPLVAALNRLFERIVASIAAEKRFTADAAHELRTPVAAIRAQAEVARGATTDRDRGRALESVIAGCDRAAHLVEQLLTLARLDHPSDLRRGPCGLRAVAAEALADVAPYAASRNVALALVPGDEVTVTGEAALLRIMVRNLVDNAARYSPAGTRVEVALARTDHEARVTVADRGPGIPEADRERVFERFYRATGSGAEGTGLGLSIVRRIAELHGAALKLCPGPGGKGLAVTATFPPS